MPTYIVKYVTLGRNDGDAVTLTITGTQKQVVAWLRDNVDDAWGKEYNNTLARYIAEVVSCRDQSGGTSLWGIYTAQGEEIREFVNDREWEDNEEGWVLLPQVTKSVTL